METMIWMKTMMRCDDVSAVLSYLSDDQPRWPTRPS